MSIVKKHNPSYKSQKTQAAHYLLFALLFLIFYFPAIAGMAANTTSLKEITVVSDDNYPPFIFRDEKGHLQGILVDEWRLWEEKTGSKADLRGMDWDKAQKTMTEGNA
ncbi:MAG: transporter substrate-binding domain-containing protein [Syntrophobacterales bacterium]|nr:transporter substrate-binding domain-containing protein [Syntrophobacterales bacterium]